MFRYYRNKRLNELFREELEKENPILPRRFQIKQREREADEECKIQKEFGKESLKTELKLLQVRFIRQQKFIMDIDIDTTNSIRNQHTEDIAVNLIQQKPYKRDMISSKPVKTKKQKNMKIPKTKKKKNYQQNQIKTKAKSRRKFTK